MNPVDSTLLDATPPSAVPAARAWGLESVLRSSLKRSLLLALLVVSAAVLSTYQEQDLLEVRSWRRMSTVQVEIAWFDIFWRQVLHWTLWALIAPGLVGMGAWMLRRPRSGLIFLLLQIPLSGSLVAGISMCNVALMAGIRSQEWTVEEFEQNMRRYRIRRFQREYLVYWIVMGMGYVMISFPNQRRQERRAVDLALKAAHLEAELAKARIVALRGQLHPHFLFNALNSVSGLIRADEGRGALRALSRLGQLLRASIDQAEEQTVALGDDIAVVRLYLEVEELRFGERLRVEFTVDSHATSFQVPALLLLTLVENAVKYAVAPRIDGGLINVSARLVDEGDLLLRVSDDGPGFPADVLGTGAAADDDEHRHIGLENTHKRVEMIYGRRARVGLSNPAGGGACIELLLPAPELEKIRDAKGTVQ